MNKPSDDIQVRELEWLFKDENYKPEHISDFAASADGSYLAVDGDRLAVFRWDGNLYQLEREPLESRLNCVGANFKESKGLTYNQIKELRNRDAIV